MPRVYVIVPELDRFWQRVDDRSGPDGCWHWTGGKLPNGYGRFCLAKSNGRGTVLAHRYAYELANGGIVAGLDVDHTCHNADLSCLGGPGCLHRRCVNPAHLEQVTRRINTLRGRGPAAANAAKAACPKGHPYDYVGPKGNRKCLVCARTARHAKRNADVTP